MHSMFRNATEIIPCEVVTEIPNGETTPPIIEYWLTSIIYGSLWAFVSIKLFYWLVSSN